jgi:hypothetical protein
LDAPDKRKLKVKANPRKQTGEAASEKSSLIPRAKKHHFFTSVSESTFLAYFVGWYHFFTIYFLNH